MTNFRGMIVSAFDRNDGKQCTFKRSAYDSPGRKFSDYFSDRFDRQFGSPESTLKWPTPAGGFDLATTSAQTTLTTLGNPFFINGEYPDGLTKDNIASVNEGKSYISLVQITYVGREQVKNSKTYGFRYITTTLAEGRHSNNLMVLFLKRFTRTQNPKTYMSYTVDIPLAVSLISDDIEIEGTICSWDSNVINENSPRLVYSSRSSIVALADYFRENVGYYTDIEAIMRCVDSGAIERLDKNKAFPTHMAKGSTTREASSLAEVNPYISESFSSCSVAMPNE